MSGIVRIEEVGKNSIDRVNKLLNGFPEGIRNATYNALSRAANSAKTKAGQFAAAEYTIGKGTFMSNVNQKYHIHYGGGSLSGGLVSVSISYAGSVLPLLTFNTRYSKNGGMQTQVKRSGSASSLAHVFAARISGSIGAYERIGSPRFPVEGKYGPSTAHMMQSEEVVSRMDETIRTTYETRIEHEITRLLNGW